jgi:hypothetical protein
MILTPWRHQMTEIDRPSSPAPSAFAKISGITLRTLFLLTLIAITFRVASPQREVWSSLHEAPSDVMRVILGLAAGVWLAVHILWLPRDSGAYATWSRLGIVLLPLALLCAYVVW